MILFCTMHTHAGRIWTYRVTTRHPSPAPSPVRRVSILFVWSWYCGVLLIYPHNKLPSLVPWRCTTLWVRISVRVWWWSIRWDHHKTTTNHSPRLLHQLHSGNFKIVKETKRDSLRIMMNMIHVPFHVYKYQNDVPLVRSSGVTDLRWWTWELYFRATYCTAHIVTAPDTNAETNCNDNGDDDDDTVFWLIVVSFWVYWNYVIRIFCCKIRDVLRVRRTGTKRNGAVLKPPTWAPCTSQYPNISNIHPSTLKVQKETVPFASPTFFILRKDRCVRPTSLARSLLQWMKRRRPKVLFLVATLLPVVVLEPITTVRR